MSELIKVGMAEVKPCISPDRITTLGLGSCVGIALRDPMTGVGGLAHIMLPDSTALRNAGSNMAKFADTGIDLLLGQMEALGARRNRLEAKIAGGAMMFKFKAESECMNVGARNVEAVRKKLGELNIPILAADTGENFGRTVIYEPQTGAYIIRAVGKPEKTI